MTEPAPPDGPCASSCAASLRVAYVNLPKHTERRAHIDRVLAVALAHAARACPSMIAGGLAARHEGVAPTCERGRPCRWNGTLAWSEHAVYHNLESSFTRRLPESRRAGALGAWLSHVGAWHAWQRTPPSAAASTPRRELLLLVDDDVYVSPALLTSLPCMLARLPPQLAASWHAIRFSTWGARFEDDRVQPTPGRADLPIYRARPHPYNGSGPAAFAYGGVHATLVQRATVGELVAFLLANGVMPIDVALRETPPPARGTRQKPPSAATRGRAAESEPAPRSIHSLVVFTDLVQDLGASFASWRQKE